MSRAVENTDRELWRGPDEGNGSYYADSIHVTKRGGIGINCGGTVYVRPVRSWHKLAEDDRIANEAIFQLCVRNGWATGHGDTLADMIREIGAHISRLTAERDAAKGALEGVSAFVGIMFGKGPAAAIPETVTCPLGFEIKLGEIMRKAETALATTSDTDAERVPQTNGEV